MSHFEFQAIGTTWTIDIEKELSFETERIIFHEIQKRIYAFDETYSRFRANSLVTEMSQKVGRFVLPNDAEKMMGLYRTFFDITHGLVTPLVGQTLVDLGYDAQYSLKEKDVQRVLDWDQVMDYKHPVLEIKKPVLLDFGAGGKGYLVDIVSEILEKNGIGSYCVDAGGDMRYRNTTNKLFRVGLENPENIGEVIGVVKITNQSLCGSAGNRRRWKGKDKEFHHVIHPKTLTSPEHMLAVWTVADSTLLADLLTTALYFTTPDILKKHFDFEYLILRPDYSIEQSEGFIAEVFIKE